MTTNNGLHLELTRQIVEWIKLQRLQFGDHVTEQVLSTALNVSRSPIRAAFSILVDRGILERKVNRGCFIACDPSSINLDDLAKAETKEQSLYRQLAFDRFNGDLTNEVSESQLLRRYDCGRALLYSVLRQLSNDGLITRKSGKGWRFEPTLNTEKSHDDSYRLRLVVEPAAILEPTFSLDEDLAKFSRDLHERILREGVETFTMRQLFDADAGFHDLIGVSSRNMYFDAIIKTQNRLRRVLEYQFLDTFERLEESCREHLHVLDALENGQRTKASDLLYKHISHSSESKPVFFAPLVSKKNRPVG